MKDNRTVTGNKGSILVVDDDRLVLATVVHGLSQAGYTVIDADNGDEAILLAREHRPDLALLDIRMEGKSGFDVAAYLREVPRVPFMFLSAFSDEDTRNQAMTLGALSYLVKPLDVAQLLPLVDEAMRRVRNEAAPLPVDAASAAVAAVTVKAPQLDASELALVHTAAGVVMHRYSVTREQAMARLQRQAREQGLSLATQAARVVDAVEELARAAL